MLDRIFVCINKLHYGLFLVIKIWTFYTLLNLLVVASDIMKGKLANPPIFQQSKRFSFFSKPNHGGAITSTHSYGMKASLF